jgi:hypothetical protein
MKDLQPAILAVPIVWQLLCTPLGCHFDFFNAALPNF